MALAVAAYAHSDGARIDVVEFLRSPARMTNAEAVSPCLAFHSLKREALQALEREYFARLHAQAGGNVSEISRRCGLSRPMVREYLLRHRLRAG